MKLFDHSRLLVTSCRLFFLAIVMFVGGWIGMKMAVPPGYASPLWPPAGIALSGLLIWGRRLWPGVLLGAIANQLLAISEYSEHITLVTFGTSFLIACASTLQALAAACLVAKWVQPGLSRLDEPRSIVIFFVIAGPLSCLIAATIGISTLLLCNVIPLISAMSSWWNWWVGDSLGVLIITPLSFCLFGKPRELWRPRCLSVALPLLGTLLALVAIFTTVFRAEQSRVQTVFNSQAIGLEMLFVDYAHDILDSALVLQDFYRGSAKVQRHEFTVFSQSILTRHPEIQALEWLPRVPYQGLRAFEKQVRAEGFPGFRVTERDRDGAAVAVQKREEYFPILFVEPMAGNEQAFGLDSSSNPISGQSKQFARNSRQPSASQRLRLMQRNDPDPDPGVLISIPVFKEPTQTNQTDFTGFVSAVVLPARIAEIAFREMKTEAIGITLTDLSAPPEQNLLYAKPVKKQLGQNYRLKSWQYDFPFADRTWRIDITPDSRFIIENGSNLPWITLIGGLCFTALLSVFLLTISGRTAQIQVLVDNRTRELAKSNAELEASEAKLRTLVESQPECVKLLARDGSLLEMNRAGLAMLGADNLEQLLGKRVSCLALPLYQNAFADLTRRVFAGESGTLEFEALGLTGERLWLDTHAVPLRDRTGNIIALLGLTRDITRRKQLENDLRENEQKLNNILNNLDAYVYLKDTQGRYLYANRMLCDLWESAPDEIIGNGDDSFFDAKSTAIIRLNDYRVLQGGEILKIEETSALLKTGNTATYFSTKLPLRNEQGEIYALVGISTDITERKQAEESLKLAARVFGEAHEGILITDEKAIIIDVNPTFSEITGYSREEVIGKNPSILKSDRHTPEFYLEMWNCLKLTRHWQGEVWNRKQNGELYAELLTISALCDEQGCVLHYVGLFSDITQSKQQVQMLELLAHYDPLTHLPNRAMFADRLLQGIARNKRDKTLLAICFLDLDGFKPVNDKFGHKAGDQVLIEVAERIKNSVREGDSVSRHGGDEFALLLVDIHSVEQCEQTIQRIHQAIAKPYLIEGQAVNISASSGITLYPLDDADPDTLLRHADQAMYKAKLAGKNRYCLFDAGQDRQIIDRHKQARDIEAAFLGNEFCLYYQPKVNIKTGQVIGVEALIRWLHPERGMIPPLEFLPVIVASELEIRIGNWVIEQAWRQLAIWHRQGLPLEVSVNISAYHLQWSGFNTHLESVIQNEPAIASKYLQLEILESSALDDLATVSRIVKTCREEFGVGIALDDFGTGYSSLTHLRRLSVNTVKIDQSFVRDMLDDPDDYAIVESVIGLSQAFRREVVAEGVENKEQGVVLLLLGCHLLQGYSIARPMPAAAISDWVKAYRPYAEWSFYADAELTSGQTMMAIRKIDTQQWLLRIKNCLHPESGVVSPVWPIMEPGKCHLGRWLKLARQNSQYSDSWLEQVEQLHLELHRLAKILMCQVKEGQLAAAQAEFQQLQALHQQLDECFVQYG